jgi:hypothetical protein
MLSDNENGSPWNVFADRMPFQLPKGRGFTVADVPAQIPSEHFLNVLRSWAGLSSVFLF